MERTETKNEIIRIGTEIISRNGYNTTGIDAILKKAKVPKGSFYYYFPSKEDFGLAVIERFAEEHLETIERFLTRPDAKPLERIREYLVFSISNVGIQGCKKGCLIGNLSQEMASQHEKFRKRLEEVFVTWKRKFAATLGEAKEAGDLRSDSDVELLAEILLAGWQGAVLRSKVVKSEKPMHDFVRILFERILK